MRRLGIFAVQRVGQPDPSFAPFAIPFVQGQAAASLFGDRLGRRGRQHDDAVLVALALAHDDLAARRIDVLDAEPAALHEPEAGAVHQPGHQTIRFVRRQPVQAGQEPPHFLAGQDHGQTAVAVGAKGVHVAEIEVEHVTVEEEEGGEGLILGTGRDAALHGEEGEEALDLLGAHRVGMAEAVGRFVEADVLFDPADVAALGFQGQAAEAGDMAHLVKQFHGRFLRRRSRYRSAALGNRLFCAALQLPVYYQLPRGGGIVNKNTVSCAGLFGLPP